MSKSQNPFDPFNLMQHFDPAKFMEQLGHQMDQYMPPGIPSQHLLDQQRKNLTSLAEANQALLKGYQEIIQRQTTLFHKATAEAGKAAQKLQASEPSEIAIKQAELFEEHYSRFMEHMQEVVKTLTQAQQQALKTLDERWQETLQEIKK